MSVGCYMCLTQVRLLGKCSRLLGLIQADGTVIQRIEAFHQERSIQAHDTCVAVS